MQSFVLGHFIIQRAAAEKMVVHIYNSLLESLSFLVINNDKYWNYNAASVLFMSSLKVTARFLTCLQETSIFHAYVSGCSQKFPDWPPVARTANGTALCR
jgi:hypothetical protein